MDGALPAAQSDVGSSGSLPSPSSRPCIPGPVFCFGIGDDTCLFSTSGLAPALLWTCQSLLSSEAVVSWGQLLNFLGSSLWHPSLGSP